MVVTYICIYSTVIGPISSGFDISQVNITGATSTGYGDLAAGFSIEIDSQNLGIDILIGSILEFNINWSVTLSDVFITTQSCDVVQGRVAKISHFYGVLGFFLKMLSQES